LSEFHDLSTNIFSSFPLDGTDKKAKEICEPFGLQVRGTGGEHTPIGEDGTIDLSPRARFCISEAEIACALYKGVKSAWEAEQSA